MPMPRPRFAARVVAAVYGNVYSLSMKGIPNTRSITGSPLNAMKYLASDVGGTFTDLVLVDTAANTIEIDKVSSTGSSAEGILGGMERLAKSHGVPLGDIAVFVHGFTIATNAWLTRSGARVAMVVTQGFRDLLEIGTQQRSNLYSLVQKKAAPTGAAVADLRGAASASTPLAASSRPWTTGNSPASSTCWKAAARRRWRSR